MAWLPLFFVAIAFGIFNMGLIGPGVFVLIGAGILYMCDVALQHLSEVGE